MQIAYSDFDALGERDLEAWRDLARRAVEPNPFFEPEFVVPAWRHMGGRGVSLLSVRDGDEWTAGMPVQRRLRRDAGDARLGRLPGPCVVGWCHAHSFLGTPLIAEGQLDEGADALVCGMVEHGRPVWVGLTYVNQDGPVAPALRRALGGRGLPTVDIARRQRAALERREEPVYLATTLNPKRRRELGRQRRGLERELGAELVLHDRAGDPEAVERFLDLEHAGWKGQEGTSLHSIAGHADFCREMARNYAEQGRLELLELRSGERTVAMKLNLVSGDGVFCFKIAHDETLARHSPGVQLEAENVDYFHAKTRAAWSDSCAAPENEMINRLWPDRRTIATEVVPTGTPLGAIVRQALPAALRARERMRRHHDPA